MGHVTGVAGGAARRPGGASAWASVASPEGAAPGPQSEGVAGYLFAFFAGDHEPHGEEVRFALSAGADPLHWRTLPGLGTLASTIGTRGVRDPFLIRLSDDEGFALLGTDLRVYASGDWDAAARHGSRDMLVWRSDDLISWGAPQAVTMMPAEAGCVWAPEAVHDPATGEHLVFWASTLYDPQDLHHAGESYHRMMAGRTRDFRTFSPPTVWADAGTATIDSTVVQDDAGLFYRFTKDERKEDGDYAGFVFSERSANLAATRWEPVARDLGRSRAGRPGLRRAEGPIVVREPGGDGWLLFLDEFGHRGYLPLRADRLDSAHWTLVEDHALPPEECRHGSIMALTAAEYARLVMLTTD
ncbi:glycoside hydrolase family 43 protein [Cellulomonas fimi]|uniref:Glycoside hydrolase family 43 protein n=1 Tax=Cellulomonas fimi TaxID=1708 RepID=A0A7Y0QHK8_CELFI|nr:glycoside hydrolase family 43 protein [Cellulomonas fimi]NMR19262.1 glycoside hydrolase family 43 protein [Cellulomonas fimi]